MVELADIFHRHGPEYLERFADRMLPSHIRAMQDIVNCRTPTWVGGHIDVKTLSVKKVSTVITHAVIETAPSVARIALNNGLKNNASGCYQLITFWYLHTACSTARYCTYKSKVDL